MAEPMTPEEEYDFYAEPPNQEPQGTPRRRGKRLTAPIPVRFPPEELAESSAAPMPTTDRSRRGSDARSSMN